MQFFLFFSSFQRVLLVRRAKRDARGASGGGRPPRVDLCFSLFLSLFIARAGALGHTRTHPLFHRQNKTSPTQSAARFWKKAVRENRGERGKNKEREKKKQRRRKNARVLIETKKARRSRSLPSENIKFEDGIGMSASGIARSDQFERKDAFAR